MENRLEKSKIIKQLDQEINKWEAKLDEVKLQLHLGAKDAKDKIDPYVKEMEQKIDEAKNKWNEIADASENAWDEIHDGLKGSFKSMSVAFDKAKKHFK